MKKLDALIWAKDDSGTRHLCPMDGLSNANRVTKGEISKCIDSDSRLASRRNVPSNDKSGKIKFAKSVSLN
jgi:hypothetical protein